MKLFYILVFLTISRSVTRCNIFVGKVKPIDNFQSLILMHFFPSVTCKCNVRPPIIFEIFNRNLSEICTLFRKIS